MDAIAGLSFAHPRLLWLLLFLPAVALFLFSRERLRERLAHAFVSERLRGAPRLRMLRPFLLTLAVGLVVVALAGPRLGFTTEEIEGRESNLVVVIDTSTSMAADDTGASRLTAATAFVGRLAGEFDGRIGLVIYEGTAEVVAPLTDDAEALVSLLETIGPGQLEVPGSNAEAALARAITLLERAPEGSSEILLVTDGENRGGEPRRIGEHLAQKRIPMHLVVVGTGEGSTIPTEQGPLRDEKGEVVVTRASAQPLGALARRSGGEIFVNPFTERAVANVRAAVSSGEGEVRKGAVQLPVERFQLPLAGALLALALASLLNRGAE